MTMLDINCRVQMNDSWCEDSKTFAGDLTFRLGLRKCYVFCFGRWKSVRGAFQVEAPSSGASVHKSMPAFEGHAMGQSIQLGMEGAVHRPGPEARRRRGSQSNGQ